MIVRIATEGQYRVASVLLDRLNELDNRLVQMVAGDDGVAFSKALGDMLSLIREQGTPLPADELVGSDLILPAPDTTIEEARELFVGEGIIPG